MSREALEWLWEYIKLHPKQQYILYLAVKYGMSEEDLDGMQGLYSGRRFVQRP